MSTGPRCDLYHCALLVRCDGTTYAVEVGPVWNVKAAVSWALRSTGLDVGAIAPPPRGRAPGWLAGLRLAEREASQSRAVSSPARSAEQAASP